MEWITNMIIGTILGFLAGIGTGGGSLLLLWLTTVRGLSPADARTVNLLFFLPSALIATVMRRGRERLRYKHLLPAIVAGCIAAVATSLLSRHIDTELLKKIFGGLLIGTGIREVLYREKS